MSVGMLSRFCNLCAKNLDGRFLQLQKRYNRPMKGVRLIVPAEQEEKEAKKREPIIQCKRGQFNFYQGDVYGKREKIELASKGWLHRLSRGDYITIFPVYDDMDEDTQEKANSFEELNLSKTVCDKLNEVGITKPLEIQQLGIPKILAGHNCVLAAETGCGKTLAYLPPIIDQILEWKSLNTRKHNTPLAFIITPTRELAIQIGLEAKKLAKGFGISTRIYTGGKTKRMLRDPPLSHVDIIVASFGVLSKLTSTRIYDTRSVRHLVLDEADAMFHETFEDKLRVFLRRIRLGDDREIGEDGLPVSSQLTLVSATMPSRIEQIFYNIISMDKLNYVMTGKVHRILVPQKFVRVGPSQKPEELLKYVKPKIKANEPVIVFSNTNSTADWVKMFLEQCEIPAINLSGSMPLAIRKVQYRTFRSGKTLVLSTTNAASRGLDTTMVKHILNYDFPMDTADYIHRCGRTGRVGTVGKCRVTSFISRSAEVRLVQKIERAIRKRQPIPLVNILNEGQEGELEVPFEEDLEEDIDEDQTTESIPY